MVRRHQRWWPTHTYNRAGTYTVSLTFTSPDVTLSKKKEHYITVLPLAHYYPTPLMGWAPSKVTFSDWSSGEPASYLWDFDDGTTSTDNHPIHTYGKAGEYVPHLTVARDGLSDTLTKVGASGGYGGAIGSGVIIVMPVADFSSSTIAGPAPLQVSFTNLSRGFPESMGMEFRGWFTVEFRDKPEPYLQATRELFCDPDGKDRESAASEHHPDNRSGTVVHHHRDCRDWREDIPGGSSEGKKRREPDVYLHTGCRKDT